MLIELLTDKYPGMRFWLTQRLTALVMAAYLVLVLLLLVIVQPARFEAWHALVSPIWFRLATILFFASLCMHAWLGVRGVWVENDNVVVDRLGHIFEATSRGSVRQARIRWYERG